MAPHTLGGAAGLDAEFWNISGDSPVANDGRRLVRDKIDVALNEVLQVGIYPVLWETPHAAASPLAYSVIAEHFSTAIETRLAMNDRSTPFYVPFLIDHDLYAQQIVPDNLGYVSAEDPSVDDLLRTARANLVVRDGFASGFFHPYVSLRALRSLIRGVQSLGYSYIDLKKLNHVVRSGDDLVVATGEFSIEFTLRRQYLKESFFNDRGQLIERTGSEERIDGAVRRRLALKPGWTYVAEGVQTPVTVSRGSPTAGPLARPVGRPPAPRTEWKERPTREAHAAVLWNAQATGVAATEQEGMVAALRWAGMSVTAIDLDRLGDLVTTSPNLILVPRGVPPLIGDEWRAFVIRAAQEGSNVILSGKSRLSDQLGIEFSGYEFRVVKVQDNLFPSVEIAWSQPVTVTEFRGAPDAEVLIEETESGIPVAVAGQVGTGRYIFLGAPFSIDGTGYDRFPYLVAHLQRQFGLASRVRSDGLEVFFDPGLRPNVSVERLTATWRRHGVRVIHAAAWHFYPNYDFDYQRLIRSAHANGLLVYAWFELPQLTETFWTRRPWCREKSVDGRDARADWRFPLALTDPRCLTDALAEVRRILETHDWDGVNFAELNFNSAAGFDAPAALTPFHRSARRDFASRYGFDPRLIFDEGSPHFWKRDPSSARQLEEFRVDWVVRLHEAVLSLSEEIARSKHWGFEVVVTILDNLSEPRLRQSIGVDAKRLLGLQERFDFSLAVEDPQSMWSTSPGRYERIGALYAGLVPDPSKLLIDINILGFREAGRGFSTDQQTGVEVQELLRAATRHVRRVLIYAESTLFDHDLEIAPYALASRANVSTEQGSRLVKTAAPVVLELERDVRDALLDGRPWPAVSDVRALIPAGEHRLSVISPQPFEAFLERFRGRAPLCPRIKKLSAELLDAEFTERGIGLEYSGRTRTIVVVSSRPRRLVIDGEQYPLEVLAGDDGYAVMLPGGRHRAELLYPAFSGPVHSVSLFLTLSIAAFGVLACCTVFLLYVRTSTVSRRSNAQGGRPGPRWQPEPASIRSSAGEESA